MTAPFLDPIIYPGTPLPDPIPGRWGPVDIPVTCRNGEAMGPGEMARWTGTHWECRDHALTVTP